MPTTSSGRFLRSATFALMFVSAVLTSLMVDLSVALFGLRRMSSHPAGATNELSGSSRFPVSGEGGRMGVKDGAEYEGSLVGESGGGFINRSKIVVLDLRNLIVKLVIRSVMNRQKTVNYCLNE